MSVNRRRFLQAAAIGAASCGAAQARAASWRSGALEALDDYVTAAMSRWQTPGMAIAVVQDGELLAARGYGVRSIEAGEAVDAQTQFSIASCSKAFTAAAIAKLVERGKVGWDDPIVAHWPSFDLARPELTGSITIRQALAHRSGLPAANMLWRSGAFDGDEILSRLRWLEPVAAPGERFLYNNVMYAVLGKLIEHSSGMPWVEFLARKLLAPLAMTATYASGAAAEEARNRAAPHAADGGRLARVPRYCPDSIAPSGAIHSCASDMAKWLIFHLDRGSASGKQLLSSANIDEMHAPFAPTRSAGTEPPAPEQPAPPIDDYGLGWFVNEYAGEKVIEHSGVQNGFVAWVAMAPSRRLGLVVLSNLHRTGLNYALRSWLLDAALGREERDWSEIVRADYAGGYRRLLREAKATFDASRKDAAPCALPLAEYAGEYESRLYGRVRVSFHGDRLSLQFGTRFDGALTHWQDNSFRATFPNPRLDDWLVTFDVREDAARSLRVKESPWAPAWYDDADDLGVFDRR
jgi:CubicO group peptidase (beta-lactamase class C family)